MASEASSATSKVEAALCAFQRRWRGERRLGREAFRTPESPEVFGGFGLKNLAVEKGAKRKGLTTAIKRGGRGMARSQMLGMMGRAQMDPEELNQQMGGIRWRSGFGGGGGGYADG